MPRAKTPVNPPVSTPILDLHFHGMFGIDLMRAQPPELEELSRKLWKSGVSAFAPTTLSSGLLESALPRLGQWIEAQWSHGPRKGLAFPVGIHLEGPFLAQSCCGAHPPEQLLEPSLGKLRQWWDLSGGTLSRLTLAPERGPRSEIRRILRWAERHSVSVSLGHSQATAAQARYWHRAGIRSLTHAWNAMPFHHRDPGILGAFLGQKNTFIEIIPDGTHVSFEVLDWTHKLHGPGVYWVSDAVPAGGAVRATFGELEVQWNRREAVCRTLDGKLAGGALPLSKLATQLAKKTPAHARDAYALKSVLWETPWKALGITPLRSRWMRQLAALHASR